MFMIHEQPQILNYIRIQISDAISACNYTADEYKSSVTIIVASDKSVTRPFSSNLVKMKQDREKTGQRESRIRNIFKGIIGMY